jgi:hypothetical protein
MSTSTSVLLGGSFVVLGQWVQGKSLGGKVVVATLFVAVLLSLMSQVNDPLARKFGLLFLVTALFGNALPVLEKVGLIK